MDRRGERRVGEKLGEISSSQSKQLMVKLRWIVPISILLVAFAWLALHNSEKDDRVETTNQDTIAPREPEIKYGLVADSFDVHEGSIKPNQFLADILLQYHISYPEIDKMVKSAEGIFDVKRMMSGKKYSVFCAKDSLGKAQCFVYEPSATQYIVFDLRDSVHVYKGERPIRTVEKEVYGTIETSMWDALTGAGTSPALAMELAEIYAWSIDFYRIQKGDHFKVIFEELYVEDKFVGVGKVQAALFNHRGEDFYGFHFVQDSIGDYFDENAKSLRKAFLQAPLKYSRISSGFTRRRFHPVQKRWKAHLGTDYAAPKGTPIMAVGDGVVTEARYKKYNGNYVKIKHNGTYTTQYLHMSKFAKGIKVGKMVRQGDIIGYVGSTGLATGPHVCFRFWKHGKQVNHRQEKLPPSKPVKPENKEKYEAEMKKMKLRLDQIGEKKQPA